MEIWRNGALEKDGNLGLVENFASVISIIKCQLQADHYAVRIIFRASCCQPSCGAFINLENE